MARFILVLTTNDNPRTWEVRNSNDVAQVLVDHPYYNSRVSHSINKKAADTVFSNLQAIDVRTGYTTPAQIIQLAAAPAAMVNLIQPLKFRIAKQVHRAIKKSAKPVVKKPNVKKRGDLPL